MNTGLRNYQALVENLLAGYSVEETRLEREFANARDLDPEDRGVVLSELNLSRRNNRAAIEAATATLSRIAASGGKLEAYIALTRAIAG